jgi:hypothetical protein
VAAGAREDVESYRDAVAWRSGGLMIDLSPMKDIHPPIISHLALSAATSHIAIPPESASISD